MTDTPSSKDKIKANDLKLMKRYAEAVLKAVSPEAALAAGDADAVQIQIKNQDTSRPELAIAINYRSASDAHLGGYDIHNCVVSTAKAFATKLQNLGFKVDGQYSLADVGNKPHYIRVDVIGDLHELVARAKNTPLGRDLEGERGQGAA